jgi:hypothetical protein
MWGARGHAFAHHGKGVIFLLKNAHDTKMTGSAIFPETLRSELREVRATIERHSAVFPAIGAADGDANGLMLGTGNKSNWNARVRVTNTDGYVTVYNLDRWD